MLHRFFIILLIALIVSAVSIDANAGNLPRSREATLIEATSPSEVLVRATGIGYWEKGMSKYKNMDNFLTNAAENDARKAALYFVLYGGSDPMLKTDAQRAAFSKIEDSFFSLDNIRKFIAWEGTEFLSRVKKPIKKKKEYELHIEKAFKINVRMLEEELVKQGALTARTELAEAVGLPFIMVVPAVKKGQNPIDVLKSNANLSHAAKVIESHLTAAQYDVVVPEQQVEVNELVSAQQMLSGVEEDYSYQLALSVGSDVYISYEVNIDKDEYNTKKAIANVRAYETTTARLLGAETGYSPTAAVAEMVLIENAVNDAIDKVLSRINAYWNEDISRGIQYKLIVSISDDFDKDEAEEISFIFLDILDSVTKGKNYKENIVTKGTLDYLLWCDPAEYDKSTKLYRDIKKAFKDEFEDGDLQQVNINRKLMLLKIEKI